MQACLWLCKELTGPLVVQTLALWSSVPRHIPQATVGLLVPTVQHGMPVCVRVCVCACVCVRAHLCVCLTCSIHSMPSLLSTRILF